MAAFFAAIEVALSTISNILSVGQIALEIWLATGGWLYALRGIEFYIDCKLVNFIAYVYKYFLMILDGTMFNEALTEAILKNIYMFIGVIVFFRLMMLVVKYLINPDLVGDSKIGVNALVQRVIIGICGIIFTPTIFSIAMRLQSAILEDQIIQKLIIPSDIMEAVGNTIDDGGKYIGTYVLSGFVSPAADASSSIQNEYKKALNKGDLSSIDINKGGYLGYFSDYQYEYFILISTFILAYVLWQILKYTLDLASRAFRLLLYQILAPVAMVEYMINGSEDGVFKSWKTATISTYCMIFVRVMAIWFVVFVTMLMSGKFGTAYTAGSLLAVDDYLLRAIIIIALLGFMMDLPKLVGQVFGLDLEQEGSATGILKQVGSIAKAGLAIGGAAVGGAIGTAKAIGSNISYKDKNGNQTTLGAQLQNRRDQMAAKHGSFNAISKASNAALGGLVGATLSSNSFTGAAYKGYADQSNQQKQAKKEAREESKTLDNKEKERIQESVMAGLNAAIEVTKKDSEGRPVDAQVNIGVDPVTMAQNMGMMQGMQQANAQPDMNQPNTTQQAGKTTVEVNDIEVKVTGKAVANYDGGLETNITGKATTTYNGDLETTITGNATAKYNNDLNVEIGGNANAVYKNDLNVEVQGNANATLNKDINVDIQGNANATLNKDVNVEVNGNTTAIYDGTFDTLVTGNTTATFDGDFDTMVSGNTMGIVEGGSETLIERTTKVELNDVEISRNRNNNRDA